MAAKATVQCPDLASASMDAVILTKENVASLKVDSSRTEPGTVVNISCLAAPQFRLVGATTLTCLANGQWDKTIPVCVPAAGSQSTNMNTVSATNNTTGSDISMLPMIVIAGIVGVIFLSLAVVMVVVLVQRGRQRNSHSKRRLDDLPADRWHMRSDPVPLDIGDIVDISSRCPPGPHVHGSVRDQLHNTLARQPRMPRDNMSVSERSQRINSPVSYNGPSQRESPSVHNYERQNIRTWHDLFFPGNY